MVAELDLLRLIRAPSGLSAKRIDFFGPLRAWSGLCFTKVIALSTEVPSEVAEKQAKWTNLCSSIRRVRIPLVRVFHGRYHLIELSEYEL